MTTTQLMDAEFNASNPAVKPLSSAERWCMCFTLTTHVHVSITGRQRWGRGGGVARRRGPAASAFPPGRSECLSGASSFIEETKQNKHNKTAASRSGAAHIHTHHRQRGAGAGRVRLRVPASHHPSAGSSQVETLY